MTFTILIVSYLPFQKNESLESWIIVYWVIGAGCQIEKDLKLSHNPPNSSKIPENYCLAYIYQLVKFADLWVVVQKIFSKTHPFSYTNTHHDVINLVNHGMIKIQKLNYLENGTHYLYEIKKFLTCASDDTFW